MIDHVSIGVRDLTASTRFYEAVLAPLGYSALERRAATVGFGKAYAEFWLNVRPQLTAQDTGVHVCLRARTTEAIKEFHANALAGGGEDAGAPGLRPQFGDGYFAAFIRDLDGNCIEAVTFLKAD
jgi:catechol 2,3-dioxygenase-like lactoylglutathione lyase family enzyme